MLSILGAEVWQVSRLTFNGNHNNNEANIILAGGQGATEGNFNSGNLISDDVFENAGIGIQGGNIYPYGSVSETSVERCQFTNTGSGIQLNNWNSLDWWIWNSTFTDNTYGISNEGAAGPGDFMAEDDIFVDSSGADFYVGGGDGPQIVQGCYSTGSARFYYENGERGSAVDLTFEDNTVLDTTGIPIELRDFSSITLTNNVSVTVRQPSYSTKLTSKATLFPTARYSQSTICIPTAAQPSAESSATWG